ncbi:hypothetical protein PIIN_09542 [Serendipita indica DSM 11827]|uniref:Uncharacterized protein n=1 Tax=Serendipita indica (strain DSM 11827) TaxID=1109443 RepID=G4TW59_SERID|nr:hypothetical protein PIIN_09542 [Serendipita indica DSM 11827]
MNVFERCAALVRMRDEAVRPPPPSTLDSPISFMSGDITRSNLLPSSKEAELLHNLRAQKSTELALIDEKMSRDQQTVASADAAIGKLEKSLTKAREMLRVYEEHASQIKGTLRTLSFSSTRTNVQSDAPEPCKELSLLLGQEIPEREKKLRTEIQEIAVFCDRLKITITNLAEELRCQNHTRAVALETIAARKNHRGEIQALVENIQSCFRPIKKIPSEVWAEVFRLRVEDDDQLFLASGSEDRRSTAFTLSHVCQPWRKVVHDTPELWRVAHWRAGKDGNVKADMITYMREKAQDQPFTVVADQCQLYPTSLPSTQDVLMMSHALQEYTLHLFANDKDEKLAPPSYQPIFFSPFALVVQVPGQEPLRSTFVYRNLVNSYANVKKLTLINIFPALAFSEPFRQLTYLKVETATDARPYNLSQLMVESLEELHLSHVRPLNLPFIGHAITLPNLRKLGITPHDHELLKQLRLPALTHLCITYPHHGDGVETSPWLETLISANFTTGLTHLVLDWSYAPLTITPSTEPNTPSSITAATTDMLTVLREIQPHAMHLEQILFVNGVVSGAELSRFLDQVLEESAIIYKKVTLDGCIGFTRAGCERLSQQVEKLRVVDNGL